MLQDYADIRALINQEPTWYDNNGVPRYCEFHPHRLGVYIKYAIYAKIACQSCQRQFMIGVGVNSYSWIMGEPKKNSLLDLAHDFHYGDPPRHNCVGDSMNCVDLEIIEAWEHSRNTNYEWIRVPEHEGTLVTDIPSNENS